MRGLTPPLTTIEANLFDPSQALLQRYLDDDPSLSPEQRASLAADERVQRDRQALTETSAADQMPVPAEEIAPVPLPPGLADLVQRRIAAQHLRLPPTPHPGLIVRIDQAVGPEGPLDWDLSHPFYALLAAPTEQADIWYGWLMAHETDYATHWDLLLEAADQPYEPLAAMVQTWNPVHLYLPAISASLGQLSPQRLATVQTLATELGDSQPDVSMAAPGTLVQRTTSAGQLILTGSPLGDASDPRWRYQELYVAAADFVRAIAKHALEQRQVRQAQPWWSSVLRNLKAAAQATGLALNPAPLAALGDESVPQDRDDSTDPASAQTQRLGELIELRLLPSSDGEAVQLHLTLIQQAPLSVGVARGDQVRQQALLTLDAPEADLFIGADQDVTLFIRDEQDQVLFSAELAHDRAAD